MLKEISDSEDVLEVTGDYTGSIGGFGASHEHLDHKHAHDYYLSQEQLEEQRRAVEEKKISRDLNNQKLLIYAVIGVIGALALAGFITSGGLLPNVNKCAPPLSQTSSSFPAILGAIHGYVGGPEGLPAIGATVVAAEQQTGYTLSSIVSVDGHYFFSLPAGKYTVMVAYPDGTNKKVSNYMIEQGSAYGLDFKY